MAAVSGSRHRVKVLAAFGLDGLVDVVVDRQAAAATGLAGTPDPAAYLEAAARLGAEASRAVVIECAAARMAAGHRGASGW